MSRPDRPRCAGLERRRRFAVSVSNSPADALGSCFLDQVQRDTWCEQTMTSPRRERALTSLLWGAVAAVGEHTVLFLSIIRRIHVRFENQAPVFSVDPSGPIVLGKDAALSIPWMLAVAYGVAVALVVHNRPRLSSRGWMAVGAVGALSAVVAATAEPLWGLVVAADFAVLYPILRGR